MVIPDFLRTTGYKSFLFACPGCKRADTVYVGCTQHMKVTGMWTDPEFTYSPQDVPECSACDRPMDFDFDISYISRVELQIANPDKIPADWYADYDDAEPTTLATTTAASPSPATTPTTAASTPSPATPSDGSLRLAKRLRMWSDCHDG